MKVKLTRTIHYFSPETGLISKTVFKEYDWQVSPLIGSVVVDSAWKNKDVTKIEDIDIISEEGDKYHVELTSLETKRLDEVDVYVEIAKTHGWETLF